MRANGRNRYTLLVGKPPFQTPDIKLIYERIKLNNYEFPPNRPISSEGQSLIAKILIQDPKKRPALHQIVDHDFFTKGIFPPSIPTSAHEYPPNFANITRAQSKANYVRVRRASLLDTDDSAIGAVDVAESGSQLDTVTVQQQRKQEQDFNKAVQPASPISILLRSAREPLLVTKSPLRASHHVSENRPPLPPTNALYRKLSAVPVNGKTSTASLATTTTPFPPPPTLDENPGTTASSDRKHTGSLRSRNGAPPPAPKDKDKDKGSQGSSSPVRQPLQSLPTLQDEQNEARRQYELASQKARIVSQMAGGTGSESENGGGGGGGGRPRGKDSERNQRERREREGVVPAGKGLADEETESIKPIRETPRKPGRNKPANNSKSH